MNQATQVSRPVNTPNRKAYGLFNSAGGLIEIRLAFKKPIYGDFNFSKQHFTTQDMSKYSIKPIAIHDALGKELVGVK